MANVAKHSERDVLQTTCVYDSRERDKATTFHLETVDEMCINLLMTMHDRAHADAAAADANAGASTSLVRGGWAAITCEGNAYTGELAEGEDAKRLHALLRAKLATIISRTVAESRCSTLQAVEKGVENTPTAFPSAVRCSSQSPPLPSA